MNCKAATLLRNSDTATPMGALNTGGVYKFRDFRPIAGCMWEKIQDKAMITIEE